MIKYASEKVTQLQFKSFSSRMEVRNDQWIDIDLRFELAPDSPAPDDLIDLTALVITNLNGVIAQIVPQDEGCDCDYQFTAFEKEQIASYINGAEIQARIANLVAS